MESKKDDEQCHVTTLVTSNIWVLDLDRKTNRKAENRGLVAAEKKVRLGYSSEYWCPRGFRHWEVCATVSGSAQALCQHLVLQRTEQHCTLMRGVFGNLSHTHSKPEKPSFLAQQCSRGQPSMQQHMTINTIYTYMEKPLQNYSWSWRRFHFPGGLIKETTSCSSSLAYIKFVEERPSV